MSLENRGVVQRWFEEVWNLRREEAIRELVTEESVCFGDDGPMRGPEEFKARMYLPFIGAFPDLRIQLEAVVSDGDAVVVRWTAQGTHTGDGLGIPATNTAAQFRGMTWVLIRGGKLMEGWQTSNIPEVIRRLVEASSGQAGSSTSDNSRGAVESRSSPPLGRIRRRGGFLRMIELGRGTTSFRPRS
jgi:steroid delta-isomerase-like uncharacterized protein